MNEVFPSQTLIDPPLFYEIEPRMIDETLSENSLRPVCVRYLMIFVRRLFVNLPSTGSLPISSSLFGTRLKGAWVFLPAAPSRRCLAASESQSRSYPIEFFQIVEWDESPSRCLDLK